MKDTLSKMLAVAVLVFGAAVSRAAVTVQNTGSVGSAYARGEAFGMPADLLYGDTAPDSYPDVPAAMPVTAGTAFLLSMQFTGTPTALSATNSGFLTEAPGTTGFAPLATAGNFSTNTMPQIGVSLPEPSSQTAFYVLSGIVGLGFVVMRRRTA